MSEKNLLINYHHISFAHLFMGKKKIHDINNLINLVVFKDASAS